MKNHFYWIRQYSDGLAPQGALFVVVNFVDYMP